MDNVQIDATPPPTCGENPANNTPATAATIAYAGSASGLICPAGDVDYYKFNGSAGDLIVADVVAGG